MVVKTRKHTRLIQRYTLLTPTLPPAPGSMSNCTSYLVQTYLEEPPTRSSLLWIAVGVGALCLVLQAALTLLFAKLLPAGPWTSQPAFAA